MGSWFTDRCGGVSEEPYASLNLGFHVGDETCHTRVGYTGRPIDVDSHRRRPDQVAHWLRTAGFDVEAELVMHPDAEVPGSIILARSRE